MSDEQRSADAALLTSSHLILHLFSVPSIYPCRNYLSFLSSPHALFSLFFCTTSSPYPFLFHWSFAFHLSSLLSLCSLLSVLFYLPFFYSPVKRVTGWSDSLATEPLSGSRCLDCKSNRKYTLKKKKKKTHSNVIFSFNFHHIQRGKREQ